jgi:lipoxygenase homology domain-containing protein 1
MLKLSMAIGFLVGSILLGSAAHAQDMIQYKIAVKTGEGTWAATNSKVYATLYGNNPWSPSEATTKSDTQRLAIPDHRSFQRGQEDAYTVNSYDLENVYAVRLETDNTGPHPAWYLESVKVTEPEPRGKSWTYTCNCWIDKDSGLQKVLYQDQFVPPGR